MTAPTIDPPRASALIRQRPYRCSGPRPAVVLARPAGPGGDHRLAGLRTSPATPSRRAPRRLRRRHDRPGPVPPVFVLALPAGETADRHDRRLIAAVCLAARRGDRRAPWRCWPWSTAPASGRSTVAAMLFGGARAFLSPATTALGADAGAARAAAAGHRLEFAGLAERLDHRPGPRRPAVRHLAGGLVYAAPSALYLGAGDLPAADPRRHPARRSSPARAGRWSRRAWSMSGATRSCSAPSRWTWSP